MVEETDTYQLLENRITRFDRPQVLASRVQMSLSLHRWNPTTLDLCPAHSHSRHQCLPWVCATRDRTTRTAHHTGAYRLAADDGVDRGVYLRDGTRVASCTLDEMAELQRQAARIEVRWNITRALVNREPWLIISQKPTSTPFIERPRTRAMQHRSIVVFWAEGDRAGGVYAYSLAGEDKIPIRGCSVFLSGKLVVAPLQSNLP